jgi:hypothetical protein
VAGEALGGNRVVIRGYDGLIYYADPTNAVYGARIIGMTLEAVAKGAAVRVCTAGLVLESSWSWVEDLPVFCGFSGVPVQVEPVGAAWSCVIGFPVSGGMVVQLQRATFKGA